MAGSSGGRVVPFIVPASDGSDKLSLSPDAARFLSSLGNIPIAPVCIVGKYRTGKSWLLNRLVGVRAFGVGSTIEACTKGVWICPEYIRIAIGGGQEVAVLFLDTEGIGATGATVDHDARIFSLGALLSSLLIFNSAGPIDEEAVQGLAFVANLTRHVQAHIGTGAERGVVEASRLEAEADALSAGEEGEMGRPSKHASAIASTGTSRRRPQQARSRIVRASTTLADDGDDNSGASDDDSDADDQGYVAELRRAQLKRRASRLRKDASKILVSRLHAPRGSGAATPAPGATSTPGPEPPAFFPSFLWVLRDFSLDLLDDAGQRITAGEYLESCLQPQEGFSSDAQSRNRTRRLLTGYFRERHCATVVRPFESETQLQDADALPDTALRPLFVEQMSALRSLVLEELVRPKTVDGQFVTGRMLAGLAAAYVDAMNNDAVPSVGQAWDGVSRVECQDAFDAAQRRFAVDIEKTAPRNRLPLDTDALQTAHDRARVAALDDFNARAVGPSVPRYLARLKAGMDDEWRALQRENTIASELTSERLVGALWADLIDPHTSSLVPSTKSISVDALSSALATLRERYLGGAHGPEVHRVLSAFLAARVPSLLRCVASACAADAERRSAGLRAELSAALEAAAAAQGEAEALRASYEACLAREAEAAVARDGAVAEVARARDAASRLRAEVSELRASRDAAVRQAADVRHLAAAERLGLPGAPGTSTSDSLPDVTFLRPDKATAGHALPQAAIVRLGGHAGSSATTGIRDRRIPSAPAVGGSAKRALRPIGAESIASPTALGVEFPAGAGSAGCQCTVQ